MPSELVLQSGTSSPRARRSQSVSSDRPSMSSFSGLLSPPMTVSPDPVFIAASAASQIVTNDHDSHSDTWFDQHGIEPSGETALVSPSAMKLVNRFLDQLLFNFLSTSRSTSLVALRPAVVEVLKPKLSKDAISGADQELHEYLGGGEDDELLSLQHRADTSANWDLELVWKRTRLRCMVYSSLGDMEEEDEDFYTERDHLGGPPGSTDDYSNPGVVSPAVAIFLTSILEFMGEQVLVVAGQGAYHRIRAKHEKDERDGTSTLADIAERVVIEEADMERVALDRTLGRLWRGWKKRVRSPATSISMSRSFSRDILFPQSPANGVTGLAPEEPADEDSRRPSLAAILADHENAANIPLPMSHDDVREIEIPGVAPEINDDVDSAMEMVTEGAPASTRPKSMMISAYALHSLPTPNSSQPPSPLFSAPATRKRALSVPSVTVPPFTSPKRSKPSVEEGSEVQKTVVESETQIAEPNLDNAVTPPDSPKGHDESKNTVESSDQHLVSDRSADVVTANVVVRDTAIEDGEAHTAEVDNKDVTEFEDEFTGKAKIMTSSRISIGGRISPDDLKAISRHSSVRSVSVHSLRIIDVAKSPTISRSSSGSMDASDFQNPRIVTISRPSSVVSPTLAESPRGQSPPISRGPSGSPVPRGPNGSPLLRHGSSLSTVLTTSRNSTDEVISESEEEIHESESPMTAVPAELAAAMQGVDVDPSPTSQQFLLEPARREIPPHKEKPFILGAPPVPRNMRDNLNAPAATQQDARLSSNNSPPPAVVTGAAPLAPLRELAEVAPDSSNHTFIIPPKSEARRSPDQNANLNKTPEKPKSDRPSTSNTRHNSPSRPSREEVTRKPLPEVFHKTHRPTHTSESGSSSSTQKVKPVRTSEDSGPMESKSQSFEELIRSDQTIQYTLTPETMRHIEGRDSASVSEALRPQTGRSHSSSVTKIAGLHSNPAANDPKKPPSVFRPGSSATAGRTSSSSGSRLRPNAPQPRDARVDRDSLGDFSDFIRSTGPASTYSNDRPPRMAPSVNSHRGTNGTARNASGSAPRVGPVAALPKRAESSAGRKRLEARDATVGRDSITELIDFVRAGPADREDHRIPRTIAPFRSTMDSDQMSGAVGGKAIDATLPDARSSQVSTSQSINSSMTSTTPLISSSVRTNKPLPAQSRNPFEEEDMMPKRKTRRVRDPYAIDFSDEEDEFEANSKPAPIKEESLADFLRNVPPPPDLTTTSVFESVPKPKKKASFGSRFSRSMSTSLQQPPPPRSQTAPTRGATPVKNTPIASQFSSNGAGSYVSQLDSARNPPTARVYQKTYQPREAVQYPSRTNDLADFLRNSEPPAMNDPKPFAQSMQREEPSTFGRMFGRRKKVAGY